MHKIMHDSCRLTCPNGWQMIMFQIACGLQIEFTSALNVIKTDGSVCQQLAKE